MSLFDQKGWVYNPDLYLFEKQSGEGKVSIKLQLFGRFQINKLHNNRNFPVPEEQTTYDAEEALAIGERFVSELNQEPS